MGWIILSVILGIIGITGILVFVFAPSTAEQKAADNYNDPFPYKGVGVTVALVSGVVWIFVSALMAYNTVGQLQVGLVYSYNGTLVKSIGHGTVWLGPWQHLVTENIGIQSVEFNLNSQNAAVSKDQQAIYADLQLNYEVQSDDVVHLFKTVGPGWQNILLEGRMLQDFKQVTSTYTAAQITTERAALRADTRQAMQGELSQYGIKVVDVLIKNIGYTDAYQNAITEKTIQVQKALQAEAKVNQAKAEAQQTVATARGAAESTLIKAEAQAKSLNLKGRALHNNPEVLQLEAIDKLNPNASVIICTGNCPSFLPQVAQAAAKKP